MTVLGNYKQSWALHTSSLNLNTGYETETLSHLMLCHNSTLQLGSFELLKDLQNLQPVQNQLCPYQKLGAIIVTGTPAISGASCLGGSTRGLQTFGCMNSLFWESRRESNHTVHIAQPSQWYSVRYEEP